MTQLKREQQQQQQQQHQGAKATDVSVVSEPHDGPVEKQDIQSAGDESGKSTPVKKKKPLAFYISFFAITIVVFIFSLDATTLAVAIPSIATQLGGTTLQSFWASISFLLAVVVSQPLYTSVSDIYGRKPVLQVAFLFFAIGSLVFALAHNMAGVIAGRALQGLGGGGLDILCEIIVADMTTLKDCPVYLGIKAIPIAIGSILGPSMGALFSQYASWRWIGWVNLPFLGISYPLIVFFLRLRKLETSWQEKTKQLDWVGIALFSFGCIVFVLPLSWAGTLDPWSSWRTILPLVVGALVLVIFGIYESKPALPIVPHRLFRSRTASLTLAGGFVHGMALFGLLQYLPLFYQAVRRETVIYSALSLLPTSVASVFSAGFSVVLVRPLRSYRWSVWISWVLVVVGTGLLSLLDESSSTARAYGIPIIWGVGIGSLLRVLQLPLLASVPSVDDTGHAIALLLFIRLLGSLFGLAICATLFSSVFNSSITAMGDTLPETLAILKSANQAIGFIPQLRTLDLPQDVLAPIIHAYLKSFRIIFYTLTGFSAIGAITSLFIEELSLDNEDLGKQQFQT